MKVAIALIAIIALSVFTPYAVATHVSKPVITMSKTTYSPSETIIVKGWAEYENSPTPDVLLDIIIRTPSGNEMVRESVRSDADGTFAFSFALPADATIGNYTVEVISQCRNEHRDICTNQSSSSKITVTEETVTEPVAKENMKKFKRICISEDQCVLRPVTAEYANLEILSVGIDLEMQSIFGILQDVKEDAYLTLTFERRLIDAKGNAGEDSNFVVLLGKETNAIFTELNKTDARRTLQIQIPPNTERVDIIGTRVVPEFSVVLLIMAAVIGISIAVMRFGNLLPNNHR